MIQYTKKGREVSLHPSSLTKRRSETLPIDLVFSTKPIYTHIKWGDPLKQEARMARLIAGKRLVFKVAIFFAPNNIPVLWHLVRRTDRRGLSSFILSWSMIFTEWKKKSVFRLQCDSWVWISGTSWFGGNRRSWLRKLSRQVQDGENAQGPIGREEKEFDREWVLPSSTSALGLFSPFLVYYISSVYHMFCLRKSRLLISSDSLQQARGRKPTL